MGNDEQELDFVNYQPVEMKHVLPARDRTVSKADSRYLKSAAKTAAKVRSQLDKEDRKRGKR